MDFGEGWDSGRDRVRQILLRLAAASGMAWAALSTARAEADIPYYKLNYAKYDTTYEAIDAKARKLAFFYWGQRGLLPLPVGMERPRRLSRRRPAPHRERMGRRLSLAGSGDAGRP